MTQYALKDLVSNDREVYFNRYHDGNLWYAVAMGHLADFEFPVPISDIGNATFLRNDRAILFMRYIRKHLDLLSEAKGGVS